MARRRDVREGRRRAWTYLYRGLDKSEKSTVSHPSRKRTVGAAKIYLRKATRAHTRWPHAVTLDGYAASHRAVREVSELPPGRPIRIRSSKYLNKSISSRLRSGFGVALLHRIRQRRFALRKLGVAEQTAPQIWNAVLAA